MNKDQYSIIGKKAIIDCLTEQLSSVGIPSDCKHLFPGKEVVIYKYDGEHPKFGNVYQVDDQSGYPPDFFYIVPLIWLSIKE